MRFDQCAAHYDSHAGPQRAFAPEVVRFATIEVGSEVLELGAGTGILTKFLCNLKDVHVEATDVSPSMVRIGRQAVPQAHWSVLDAFQGPVPPGSLQISSGLLQWAKDPHEVLKRWRESLRPGGRMIHAFPCEPCLKEWREIVSQGPLVWRDEPAWKSVFESAGLKVSRSALWIEDHVFGSAHEMLRSLHNSGVTGRVHLTPGRLRSCLREYDRRNRKTDGVHVTWAWLAIEAG